MTAGAYITDFGQPLRVTLPDGSEAEPIPRYGVWLWNSARQRHEVAETSDDLEALRAKYGQAVPVIPIGAR